MSRPWNLSPVEWSKVLQSDDQAAVDKVAASITSNSLRMPWVDTVIRYTNDVRTVLDMGSGKGELAAMLGRAGQEVSLMDWSEENIRFSKALFKKLQLPANFTQADMTKTLPYADNTFDMVVSCGVFEYFDDEQIKAILQEAFRIAKKKVIIMVPNARSLPYRFGKWYMEKKKLWFWGGEHPYATLKPHFRSATQGKIEEFSIGTKHSLDFLTMRGGKTVSRFLETTLQLKDHSRPARCGQGYLLFTVGEKA